MQNPQKGLALTIGLMSLLLLMLLLFLSDVLASLASAKPFNMLHDVKIKILDTEVVLNIFVNLSTSNCDIWSNLFELGYDNLLIIY